MGGTENSLNIARDLLDRLSNGVVAGPEDLMGIGECLNLLEELEQADQGVPESWHGPLETIKGLFKKIILEESPDPEADWREIQSLLDRLTAGSVEPGHSPGEEEPPPLEDPPAEGGAETSASSDEEPASEERGPETIQMEDPELIKDFVEEAKEHLASIELNMVSLEADPQDREAINAVFRPFHSIKGVAGFLNLESIHELSHEVENLLDEARSGSIDVTEGVIDIVLGAVDILKVLLGELEAALGEGQAQLSANLVGAFLNRLRRFDPRAETPRERDQIPKVGEILVEKGVTEPERVESAAQQAQESGKRIGEALVEQGAASAMDVASALREQRKIKESAASVRVDTQKLDNLVDMVGELVIAQSMVLQNPDVQVIKDQKFQKDSVQLRRITAELQRISMSLRMVPIKSTFQKLIRLVRDLSRKSGKSVRLEMRGEETEIDRNMVEEIYEPLVHMIRNAVDHGIESPDERERVGKDPQGTIYLTAEQKGGNIIIELQDDGKGLDAEKIREKALAKGLISPEDTLDDRATYELIFHPGFSTKDQVTDVSGRGVGMDVVRRSVEELRGKLEVSSVPGHGTRFELKLPLTMAIIDGMVICVGTERYVVPTVALRESLRPGKEAYHTVQGSQEMIKVRDQLMPLIRLHELFDVEPRLRNPWEALVLVVQEDQEFYCLLADEIVGRQEVVIKSLGSTLRHVKGISGGAILGDGKVALILDVKGVVSTYEEGGKNGFDRQRRVA
ncbi:two-component system, chemotaxis family, sensor kinase CheA [Desulfacinum hydrothermale DSM 13146]|uniref:Chemotaxis protein CheA n=1 Tax=Desulfacinum hydrothermale DSM 13146 TaxID=1121390 RepID=A0A1W1X7F1_9BACT|nr:chemotaxis protein CheA [Desulfacinum hydrothermale]SMC19441.1 two-component system, chemotaxis family, sensor kinase CheA [Desulfacinum hydrothermale DSM 13146]